MDLSANPDDTQTISKTTTVATETTNGAGAVSKDSRIMGVSVMAWTLVLVTTTVCWCQLWSIPLYDHMINLSLMIVGFYAGAKSSK